MKKNIFRNTLMTLTVLGAFIFTSCGVKEYDGFGVNKGIIEIPSENETILAMPLELYQGIENKIVGFANKYNNFADISTEDFEYYKKLTMDIFSIEINNVADSPDGVKQSISTIIEDEKQLNSIMKSFTKMDSSSFEKLETFVQELSDKFDILIYVIGEVADFDRDAAPWYENRKVMFDDAAEEDDVKESIAFIEKYFPSVKFVVTYEETGAAKAGK